MWYIRLEFIRNGWNAVGYWVECISLMLNSNDDAVQFYIFKELTKDGQV